MAKNSLFLEGRQCYGKFNEVLGGIQTVLTVSRGQISWNRLSLEGLRHNINESRGLAFVNFQLLYRGSESKLYSSIGVYLH